MRNNSNTQQEQFNKGISKCWQAACLLGAMAKSRLQDMDGVDISVALEGVHSILERGELLRIEPMRESDVLLMCELANVENIKRAFLLNSVKKKEVQSVIKNFSIAFPIFSSFQQKTINDLDVARFILQGDK